MEDKKLFDIKKRMLVEHLVKSEYLKDKRLLSAFMEVPLEEFIPEQFRDPLRIYEDTPNLFYYLNRENYRTISAPHMISIMLQGLSLKDDDDLLILGAKSGYIATLAHKLAPKGEIIILEANSDVAKITSTNLEKLNLHENITVVVKNPLDGMMDLSPWQKILVTGAIKQSRIQPLLRQLDRNEGVLYAPIGEELIQIYTQILRSNEDFFGKKQLRVRFTPLMTQVELVELELITDFNELEELEIKDDPYKVDKSLGKFNEKISIKYGANIFDEIKMKPNIVSQESEIDIKQRDIVVSHLKTIETHIKKLKKEEDIDNCFQCVEDIETQIDGLRDYKRDFDLKIKKIQNFLNQIRTYNIIRKDLEKKEAHDTEAFDKKIEIINKQISDINDLHNLMIKEIDRLNSL